MLRLCFFCAIFLVLSVSITSASAQVGSETAGVAFNEDDVKSLDRLDEMLDAPTRRISGGTDRSRDAIVTLASSLPERFVVVVDLRGRRVYAFEPRAQRSVEREVARDLVRDAHYSVAGIAYELLELLGATDARLENESDEDGLFDSLAFSLGARAAIGLTAEPRFVQLAFSVDARLALNPRLLLVLGTSGVALGRERESFVQGAQSASLDYRRSELGLRLGIGRSFRPRLAIYGLALFGAAFGRIDNVVTTSGVRVDEGTRWKSADFGLGIEARVALGRGFELAPSASLYTSVGPQDYVGRAGSEFHESPIRITFGLALAWGTSAGGA